MTNEEKKPDPRASLTKNQRSLLERVDQCQRNPSEGLALLVRCGQGINAE